jgi:WD40 repeat protein
LYYKNKIITCNLELKEGIKIWEQAKSPISASNQNHYQLMNKLFYPKIYGDENITYTTMYLMEDKNLLITSNDEESVCFWNLKKLKFDHTFELDWCPYIFSNYKNNLVIFGSGIYKGYRTPNELVLYDVKVKNINKKIKLDFIMLDVRYIKKIDLIVISGGTDILRNDIYVYDSNLNKVQFIRKAHYRDINGFAFYEKDGKEDLLMSYSQDGAVSIYSFI